MQQTPTNDLSQKPALPRLAYSMRETAALLGINYQSVYRLHKRGLLRSSSALRTKLFAVVEIQRFLADTMPPAPRRTSPGGVA
jgi:hypothetical protein